MLTQLFTEVCTIFLLKKMEKKNPWPKVISYLGIGLLVIGVALTLMYS